jgi:hypothetical protein
MSIGDKLRAIDEHAAGRPADIAGNQPSQKEPAEGSRETVAGGVNRARSEEQTSQNRVPRRGKTKEKGNA